MQTVTYFSHLKFVLKGDILVRLLLFFGKQNPLPV